ncbi:Limonene 1,2-monooxygenase [Bacillus sp. THAF10]|uniref:LLM class flavin-dependent oxidoreductase n=1 Tax=Bacillus sp. THAF10 TaxID=2587848 RepID=UPI00126966B8|nr:LLM class flavin-dependent oxidoreductase [Bacillus sp. THAF10]QFT89130.1 Limonene 1,2-monooxygenase [Bacillus sp. THAF10]
MQNNNIPLSVLDLAPITEGSDASSAFTNSVELAQHTENLGFTRYWLAEHHNMQGIASSATAVIIGHIAGATKTIRVGSGGIMLPNHAPLVIAEQFGTLESLYPGRIDLGLGRAPGSDQLTAAALRRERKSGGEDFPNQLAELMAYFKPDTTAKVRAVPGEGLHIPIWLLGSSGFSAKLSAELGLPFAFASHFSPDYTLPALEYYKTNFKPSKSLSKPYAVIGVNVIAAQTDEEAEYLATSIKIQFLNLIRGKPGKLQAPVENMDSLWSPYEKQIVDQQLKYTVIGSQETVKQKLSAILEETEADEIIVNTHVFDQKARLQSYSILADTWF